MSQDLTLPENNILQLVQPKHSRHRKITVRLASQVGDMPAALGMISALLDRQSMADVSLFLTILPS
jgi:hypothetical protein